MNICIKIGLLRAVYVQSSPAGTRLKVYRGIQVIYYVLYIIHNISHNCFLIYTYIYIYSQGYGPRDTVANGAPPWENPARSSFCISRFCKIHFQGQHMAVWSS